MVRMKPQEIINQTYGVEFERMCGAATNHWQLNTIDRASGPVLYVDLLSQDVRVAIRNLTLAAAIQRHVACRMVALVGPDPYWADMIWSYYDREKMEQLGRAYGAVDVLDVRAIVDEMLDGAESFSMLGERIQIASEHKADPRRYWEIAEATHMRALRIPLVTDEVRATDEYIRLERCNDAYARLYDALMAEPCVGFVTSHIDYHQWGFGVDAAMREEVPVYHIQSTGSFKAYALFPEKTDLSLTARENWTLQIADFFNTHIWPQREVLSRAAEVVAFRSKSNYGRPSWWRGGGTISVIGFRDEAERRSIREDAMRRLGFDPSKPVVAVFNHAISDAVHSNHEVFDNLAEWFHKTVEFAAEATDANWLILDHPAQAYYDGTEYFEQIADEFGHHSHLEFRQSMELTKNTQWSLIDLAVTVRGSVSNEFPAYGIPAVQAGWSEWSHIGLSMRADSQEEYWRLISETIDHLKAGEQVITEEQIAKARLWLWFYRCGTDVPSGFIPHWESLQGDMLYRMVSLALTQVESDGDAGLVAVRRMLKQREPFLTRVDLTVDRDELANATAAVGPVHDIMPDAGVGERSSDSVAPGNFKMATIFDEVAEPVDLPLDLASGANRALVVYDGLIRGVKVLARANFNDVLLGLKVRRPETPFVRITIDMTMDQTAHMWWHRKLKNREPEESRRLRHVTVHSAGEVVGALCLGSAPDRASTQFTIPSSRIPDDGLLMLQLLGHSPNFTAETTESPLLGVQLDRVNLEPADEPGQMSRADVVCQGRGGTCGLVMLADEEISLQFKVVEKPRLSTSARSNRVSRTVARARRKTGVVLRQAARQRRTSAADASAAFALHIDWLDGVNSAVKPTVTLLPDDVLQITFSGAERGATLGFFELCAVEGALADLGFDPAVELQQIR